MKRLLAALIFILLASSAYAQDNRAKKLSDGRRLIMDEVLTELVDCVAYYSIASVGMDSKGAILKIDRIQEALFNRIRAVVHTINMKLDAVMVRVKWAVEDQGKLIDNNAINMALLVDKYGASCKQAVEDFDDRVLYWTEQTLQERP